MDVVIVSIRSSKEESKNFILFSNLYDDLMLEVEEDGINYVEMLLQDQIETLGKSPYSSFNDARHECLVNNWNIVLEVVER